MRCQTDDDDDENDHDERQEQAIVVHFDEARRVARKLTLFHYILFYMMLKMWFYHLHQYFNASKWVR